MVYTISFFMIAFASYAYNKPDFSQSFSDWLSVSNSLSI
jgi:hypothetical protein